MQSTHELTPHLGAHTIEKRNVLVGEFEGGRFKRQVTRAHSVKRAILIQSKEPHIWLKEPYI